MDDLVTEFVAEAAEGLGELDTQPIELERNPGDAEIIGGIFRIVHTIKGTCGFLGLPRLEMIAHSAENVLGKFRDGDLQPNADAVSLILSTLDRIKDTLAVLEETGTEPEGDDSDLISALDAMADGKAAPVAAAEAGDDQGDLAAIDDEDALDLGAPAAEADAEPLDEIPDVAADAEDEALDLGPPAKDIDAELAAFAEAEGVALDLDPTPEPIAPPPVAVKPAPKPEAKPAGKIEPKVEAKPADDGASREKGGRDIAAAAQSIRVSVDLLEDLMATVSELVLTRNQLLQTLRQNEDSVFAAPLQRLNHITTELQEGVMRSRMQPIGNAWNKLPRIVRDLAHELGKKIDLEMIGADTELDRQVLELIKDPLTHMIRNSCDHGLETIEGRRTAGKVENGRIELRAFHEGGHVIIRISDDGKGLPTEKIRQKAVANGLIGVAEAEAMSAQDVHQLIFRPGLSTAEAVTNVSGRGVGMDVVRSNIEKIGGAIEVESSAGAGSVFTIKIPLTLAIVAALIVECGAQRFAVPQISVMELVRASPKADHRIVLIDETPVLRLRNRLLPLAHLGDVLQRNAEAPDWETEHFVVVMQVGSSVFGIVVDRVFDTEEIVVKPVAPILRDNPVFAGNTVLGDGGVAMILDPNGLIAQMGNWRAPESDGQSEGRKDISSAIERAPLLMFRAGGGPPKAAPLSLVARLEDVKRSDIETADGRSLLQYRDKIMPLLELSMGDPDDARRPVIVFRNNDRWAGLIVDEIVDIVEAPLTFEMEGGGGDVLGTMVVDGRSTEIINVGYYLEQLYPDWFASEIIPSKRKDVLIVDDSPFFRHLLCPLLQQAGYSVTPAESAEKALGLMRDGCAFDVIVSDIDMPGMDGFAFAEAVRASSEWNETPLVALSGRVQPDFVARGREAGFTEYVGKSDRERLLRTLSSALGESEAAA